MRLLNVGMLAALLLSAGCQETGRSDTIRWHALPGLERPPAELLDGAEEVLGLELVEVDHAAGAVTIFIRGPESGSSWSGGWSCTPFVHLEEHTPRVLAHELGHAFTLLHVEDRENLMSPGALGEEMTDLQVDRMREKLWETDQRCR